MRAHVVFLAASGALVAAAIAAGVMVMGGPGQERSRRLDADRAEALSRIAGALDAYHRQHRALPPSLDVLATQSGDFPAATLRDPETGQPYRYQTTGAATYRLCAVFAASSRDDVEIRWAHAPGLVCFDETAGAPSP